MNLPLVRFYDGEAPDSEGRFLAQILKWPDGELEGVHDYIQWLFPLFERSAVNDSAPLLDTETVNEFRSRPQLQENLRRSFLRMLRFYGFDLLPGPPPAVERSAWFEAQSENWLRAGDHNHLRITRMLKSISALGLEAEAKAFFDCLAEIYREEEERPHPRITPRTFAFWRAAVQPRC